MKYYTDCPVCNGKDYIKEDESGACYDCAKCVNGKVLVDTASLHARIAELEAALRMNLDASSDIAEDESIDAMRGRLQSIRAKSIHALKKAPDHE